MTKQYEYKTYGVPYAYLQEGHYTRDEIKAILDNFQLMDEIQEKAIKEISNEAPSSTRRTS